MLAHRKQELFKKGFVTAVLHRFEQNVNTRKKPENKGNLRKYAKS
jgi:hypothetical protein